MGYGRGVKKTAAYITKDVGFALGVLLVVNGPALYTLPYGTLGYA